MSSVVCCAWLSRFPVCTHNYLLNVKMHSKLSLQEKVLTLNLSQRVLKMCLAEARKSSLVWEVTYCMFSCSVIWWIHHLSSKSSASPLSLMCLLISLRTPNLLKVIESWLNNLDRHLLQSQSHLQNITKYCILTIKKSLRNLCQRLLLRLKVKQKILDLSHWRYLLTLLLNLCAKSVFINLRKTIRPHRC